MRVASSSGLLAFVSVRRWLGAVTRVLLLGTLVGAIALGAGLQLAQVRLDELPWLWRDLSLRTPMVPGARASADDIAALQDGMSVAFELVPEYFPHGLDGIDVALYDEEELLVWSRRPPVAGTLRGRWHDATIVATPVWARPTERSMRTCRGSEGFANWSRVRAVTGRESFFMCAPLTTFTALQRGRSIYDSRDSYLATVVHEFAHQYLGLHPETPAAVNLARQLPPLPPSVSAEDVLGEAFATWVELSAARQRFPTHFQRLRTDFRASCEGRADDVHCLGLELAIGALTADISARSP